MIPFVRRFVAGTTSEEALDAVHHLNEDGLKATLDYLGEECRSKEQAAASAREIEGVLRHLAAANLDCNVSLKLTQLGFNLDETLAREHLTRILDAAAERKNFVRIDMEGSGYTQRTLDLFLDVFDKRKNVGIVIQAYLRRSKGDIERLVKAGARVRLCKGAYKEPASVALQDKEEINRSYDELARMLLNGGSYPAIATHDDDRIAAAAAAVKEFGRTKDEFEFQMLFGVRRKRWHELVSEGYNVRIYVPYGTHWFPYYYRRIRERKENLVFALRSVLGD
ncbi:MAG: proline dehydrogenase family protein [Elusimicrobia bacterium]|nr:proline dehydrogenase family protein [Elusimicrobiota bacterium]